MQKIENSASPTPVVSRRTPVAAREVRPATQSAEKVSGPVVRYLMVGLLVVGVAGATMFAIARQQPTAPARSQQQTDQAAAPDPMQLNRLLEAVKTNPKDFDTQVSLGDYYFQTGDYIAATAAYSQAAALHPDNEDVQESLGNAYLRAGDYSHASAVFEKVYQANPNRSAMGVALVVSLLRQTPPKREEASELWEKVRPMPDVSDSERKEYQATIDNMIAQSTPAPTPKP